MEPDVATSELRVQDSLGCLRSNCPVALIPLLPR
jgi:hypothetical protein